MMKPLAVAFAALFLVEVPQTSSFSNIPRAFRSSRSSLNQSPPSQPDVWYSDSFAPSNVRTPVIAGNWKLNPSTVAEANTLLKLLSSNFLNHQRASDGARDGTQPEVIVFPAFPYLHTAILSLEGTGIKVGAQNVGLQTGGAFTGEVSPSMVRSLGCDYVLLGHSERRVLFEETDDMVNEKVKLCLAESGLSAILCVGETLSEYESELLESVVKMQIKKGLLGVSLVDLDRIVIAYEPVWAIGTGEVATPEQAQAAHAVVRRTLASVYGAEAAGRVRIQYGGSVTPESIEMLMSMPDVDGALVGGASLTADSFSRVVDGGSSLSVSNSPRPREITARECLSTKNVLGESPVWSTRDQALYWIDAPQEEIWMWNGKDAPYRRLFGSTIGCVILQQGKPGSIIIAAERAFLSTRMTDPTNPTNPNNHSPSTTDFDSNPTVLCQRPEQTRTTRPNDGRTDRQGRFVFGMYNNYHRSGVSEGENNSGLYRLNSRLQMEQILDYQYRVSNCICFSPDGATMYFCDTPTRKVYQFDYPQGDGPLTNRKLIWTVPANLPGGPDGAQVDADGFLWMALSGAGRVIRVDPQTGSIDTVVHLPVKSPTSCTFGGKDLDELFITTRGPDGGGLYRVKMPFGIRGVPEAEFSVETADPVSREEWADSVVKVTE